MNFYHIWVKLKIELDRNTHHCYSRTPLSKTPTIISGEEQLERNTILSFFKSAGNPGHRRPNVIFCLSLILTMMVLFPLIVHAFEDGLEKDIQKDLEQGQAIVVTIQKKLQAGSSISAEVAQLKKSVENIRISNLLMEERFKLRDEKVKSLGAKAVDRHEAMVKGYRKALTEYLALIDKLPSDGSIPQSAIRNLQSLLDKLLPKRKRPLQSRGRPPVLHADKTHVDGQLDG